MAGNFLAWIMLEAIFGTDTFCYKHVELFSNNMAAVSWTQRGTAKKSAAAGRLLIVLALQQQVARATQLVYDHVVGDMIVLGNIPYHSFGYSKT